MLLSKVKKPLVSTAKQPTAAGLYFSDQNAKYLSLKWKKRGRNV